MPISTSSSDDRIRGHLRAIWPIAIAVGATVVLMLEFLWRSMGYEPSITDDMDLWAQQRERASGRLAVALVGGSRMAMDFVPNIFEKRNPEHTVANIAIDGHRPMATLMALAEDENFSGLVIVSLLVFGELFGFFGLLIAVPLAAVLKIVLHSLVESYKKSDFFHEGLHF